MSRLSRVLLGLLLAGLFMLGGCGKKETERPARFNRVLGDGPLGAPTGAPPVDSSVLQDQTTYRPADYEPLEGRAPGASAGGAAGAEVQGAHDALRDLITAVLDLDFDLILDAFVPEQVALLREDEYMSTLYETQETLDVYWAVFKDKATAPEFEPLMKIFELVPELIDPLANAMTVTVLDEENAVATFDIQKLELPEELLAQLTTAAQQIVSSKMKATTGSTGGPETPGAPATGQPQEPGAAAAMPGGLQIPGMPAGGFSPEMLSGMAAQMQVSIPLRKVDERWCVALPFVVREDHAALINDGMLLIQDLCADITNRIDQADTLDLQTYQQIEMQVTMANLGAIMGFVGRAQAVFGPLMSTEPGETEAAVPAGEPAESAEPNAPDQDPNAAQPSGRERRRP